jgi:hypothetical protein
MIDSKSALMHYLLNVVIGELIATVPSDAQEDDFGWVVPPLEWGGVMLHGDSLR